MKPRDRRTIFDPTEFDPEMRQNMTPEILAIDPGPELSAYLYLDEAGQPTAFAKVENDCVVGICGATTARIVIEQVASYGMPVGKEVFETVFWSGRFAQRAISNGRNVDRLPRTDVKMHLCHTVKGVNDAVIRQALIDLYGPGKERAIGTKKAPGPCYGITKDCWAALALAVTYRAKLSQGGFR